MARVQNTLIGKSSGSVGGATFSSWKGINVLKSKAISVANPKTDGQVLQRSKMTLMVQLYRLVSLMVQTGFKTLAVKKSEYNAFISENIQNALTVLTPTTSEVNYPAVSLAKGTIGVQAVTSLTATNGVANATINWDSSNLPVGASLSDIAYAAIFNETKNIWGFSNSALRSADAAVVTMPLSAATSDVLHSYLFFKSAGNDEVSDSVYEGLTV